MYDVAEENSVEIICFGHAGDGNLHVVLVHEEENKQESILQVVERLIRFCLTLGGTISGEYGIGTAKAPFIPLELSDDEIHLMKSIKKILDPKNLLNSGKVLKD